MLKINLKALRDAKAMKLRGFAIIIAVCFWPQYTVHTIWLVIH
jgi:hypothetical protein